MTVALRSPRMHEVDVLEALCMRSKAYWGYDHEFLALCRTALKVSPRQIERGFVRLAEHSAALAGVAQVSVAHGAEIDLLFVDPPMMGYGIGAALFVWAAEAARAAGARELFILSDPGARGFYERMGAVYIGDAPSDAIPGRLLPRLVFAL